MSKLFKTLTFAFGLTGVATTSPSTASTIGDPTILPGSTQVGQPAHGSDMWTQAMTQLGLFRVHRDDCDATSEVFVEVFTDDNSVQFGFCIDKDEHSTGIVQWEVARDTCLAEGKRLPEPAEFKFACNNATGLNNINDDYEWSTNFATKWRNGFAGNVSGLTGIASGSGTCSHASYAWVAKTTGASSGVAFRCMR